MKYFIFLFVLSANLSIAQSFNNYNYDSQYSDQLIDIEEYPTGYLLTGYITDSANTVTADFYGAPILVKLSKSGNPIDTIITTAFGYTELAQVSVYRNGYFYTFGTTNPQNDTLHLVVTKRDTLFNLIERRVYPQLEGIYYIYMQRAKKETDTTMFFSGYHYVNNNGLYVYSYVLKYNFNTMNIDKFNYIPKNFVIYNMVISDDDERYLITGDVPYYPYPSEILTYDSAFNLLSIDTLLVLGETGNYLHSISNLNKYQDSLYLLFGEASLSYPLNNPTHIRKAMFLQVLDSNLNTKSYKYWYYDSLTHIEMSTVNALIRNSNNEYFLGGTVNRDIYFPSEGLLLVKIDSNLNTIWQKHIECTAATMRIMNMLPTDDGGILILYNEQASLSGAQLRNTKLVKVGPNGEISSIYEFKTPINRIEIELFPNPASDYVELSLKAKNKDIAFIRILDVNGKVIIQKQYSSNKAKLDISKLSTGVYLLEGITSRGVSFSKKFVKEQ